MQTVRVRLRKPSRVLTFQCTNVSVERDSPCVVRSDRGLEFGVCVVAPEPCSEDMAKRIDMQVIRKATENDVSTVEQLVRDEAKAHDVCAGRIREKNLPMKLVDVEYTFDRHKVIFYFTAEQRVDFRELVRDLAHTLKARIELRHIQVRDQAKMVGGIGECGRLLCCRTWLREFMPISMKMAKRQNLSLNPEKISGQCGRLMCCLSYENDLYEVRKKKKAPAEPDVETETEDVEDDLPAGEVSEREPVVVASYDEAPESVDPHEGPDVTATGEGTGEGAAQDAAQSAQKSRRKSRRKRRRRRKPTPGGGNGAQNTPESST